MLWVIGILLAITIIAALYKYIVGLIYLILFNPAVNSVFHFALGIILVYSLCLTVLSGLSGFPVLPAPVFDLFLPLQAGLAVPLTIVTLLSLSDCAKDIKYGMDYYGYGGLYTRKSLHCMVFGAAFLFSAFLFFEVNILEADFYNAATGLSFMILPRVVFLLIMRPYVYFKARKYIRRKMKKGYPLHRYNNSYELKTKPGYGPPASFHYRRRINRLVEKGKLVSNGEVLRDEYRRSRRKQDDKLPQTTFAKLVYKLPLKANKEAKAQWQSDEWDITAYDQEVLLCARFFEKFHKRIAEVMMGKGKHSPHSIKEFKELSDLNLKVSFNGDTKWSEFFLIKALDRLVEEGVFEDHYEEFGIQSSTINHVYGHKQSQTQMKSRDASDDPRLALDD